MPRTYKKVDKLYTEETIAEAVARVLAGAKVQPTALSYPGMSVSMLRKRVLEATGHFTRKKQGRSCELGPLVEDKLGGYVRQMARLGLGPTAIELRSIVKDYIAANELVTGFGDSMPGPDWAAGFMKRQRLSLKKGGQMQIARKNVTSDPFVIYGFYDMLEAEVDRLGIRDKPECFYNADESGFPSDPSKCRTVAAIGEKVIKITCGANRENTTVLACCSADGRAMDPLIIFRGKNLQTSWRGDAALPETQYAVSESGWITTPIFQTWFEAFCEKTKDTRPLLLLLDGQITHTTLETIEHAQKEGVSIMKLPPHTTDLLQALDVACFGPLKTYYERALTKRVQETGAREPLRKADFVNLISTIWRDGLSERNIKAGFAATGVFPPNRDKYNLSRLDNIKMKTYQRWKDEGSPVDDNGDPLLPEPERLPSFVVEAPAGDIDHDDDGDPGHDCLIISGSEDDDHDPTNDPPCTSASLVQSATRTPRPIPKDGLTTPTTSVTSSRASSVSGTRTPGYIRDDPIALTRALQRHAPPGMRYSVMLVPAEDETSFEAVIKSRGRPRTSYPPANRHRIKMHGAIITDDDYAQQIKEKTAASSKTTAGKKTGAKKKAVAKRKNKRPAPEASEASESEASARDSSGESELDTSTSEKFETNVKTSTQRRILSGEMPALDQLGTDNFFAVFWCSPRTYYWGKIVSGDAEKVELKFMHRKEPSGDPTMVLWDWPATEDRSYVPRRDCFYGPEHPVLVKGRSGKTLFKFENEAGAHDRFTRLVKYGLPSPKKQLPSPKKQ